MLLMELRPYQIKIIDDTCDAIKNKNKQLIVVPTGGGKTVIFAHIIQKLGLKTLIIAHTKELIAQAKNTLSGIAKDVDYSVETVQRMGSLRTLNKMDGSEYGLIIFDECHRAGARSYKNITEKFHNAKIIGVTATPFRHDGQKISDIFGKSICSISILDMIKEGFLCDFEGYRVSTGVSLREISTTRGDFISSRLSSVINVKNRNELIVREYLKICPHDKTLAFTANIDHAEELAKEFRMNGIICEAVHGKNSETKRKKLISDFKTGKVQILVNCQILTEGFDDPSIQCLIMARPTTSKTLYMQMIGRGSRIYPGKEACKVIEFTDNDYDVCQLEEILDSPVKKYGMERGEKLTEFSQRLPKTLEDETQETFVEKMKIIPASNIYEKKASEWEKSFLRSKGININDDLTKIEANNLILGLYNANR